MVAIIYASRAAGPMDDGALLTLLREARERNQAEDVTGMLLYTHGSFLQVLEGAPEDVDATYARITDDDRHGELRLLAREAIQQRTFAEWWMGFEHPDDADLAATLPGFKTSTTYPLVNADLVHDATVARTLLRLYARNP